MLDIRRELGLRSLALASSAYYFSLVVSTADVHNQDLTFFDEVLL